MSIESYVLKLQQEKNPGIIEKLVLEFLSGLSCCMARVLINVG